VNEKISDENTLIINKQSERILSMNENISKNEIQNSEEKDKKLPAYRNAQNRNLKDPEED